MKKLALIICAAISIYLLACTGQTASMSSGNSSEEKKNLATDSIIDEAFKTGDVSKIESVVSPDFVGHTEHGDQGRDSLKAVIKKMKTSFPDMKMEMTDQVAHGDYVYSWMHFTGITDGSMGMPKGPYDMHAIELTKYKDGKAVEHWEYMDVQEMMKMMQPVNMKPSDSLNNSKTK